MKKIDTTACKGLAIETGRHLSELLLKAAAIPSSRIDQPDIDRLRDKIDQLRDYCGIEEKDMEGIDYLYRELNNIYPTASGTRIASPIIDLINKISLAKSK